MDSKNIYNSLLQDKKSKFAEKLKLFVKNIIIILIYLYVDGIIKMWNLAFWQEADSGRFPIGESALS